jgi:hypothetical protein
MVKQIYIYVQLLNVNINHNDLLERLEKRYPGAQVKWIYGYQRLTVDVTRKACKNSILYSDRTESTKFLIVGGYISTRSVIESLLENGYIVELWNWIGLVEPIDPYIKHDRFLHIRI